MMAADADPAPAHRSSTRLMGRRVAVKPGSLLVGGECGVLGAGLSGVSGISGFSGVLGLVSGLSGVLGVWFSGVLGILGFSGFSVLGIGAAPDLTDPGPCRFPAPGGGSPRHGDLAGGT